MVGGGRPRGRRAKGAEPLELSIEKIVAGGFGLGRLQGQVVFVPETAPGDRVRVRVAEAHRDFLRASLLDLVERSPLRRAPPCPYFAPCGGCSLMHLTPEAQADAKRQIVAESLRRGGNVEVDPAALPLVTGPELGYRVRSRFHVRLARGEPVIGFHQRGSRRVVDVQRCLQISEEANAQLQRVRGWLSERPERAAGIEGFEILESAPHPGRVLTHFLVKRDLRPAAEEIASAGLGDVVVSGEGGVEFWGEGRVEYRAGGFSWSVAPGSFFQINRYLLEPLLEETVGKERGRLGRACDLYCGVGFFTLPLARLADEVVAVESAAGPLEWARENARRAELGNIAFVLEEAASFAARTDLGSFDLVVVDPPRGGLPPEVVEALGKSPPPEIRYVSCDPATLGRDLGRLLARGLALDRLVLLDLFPNTHHVETVVTLKRR